MKDKRVFMVLLSIVLLVTFIAFSAANGAWTPPKLISVVAISLQSSGAAAGLAAFSSITDRTGIHFRVEPGPTSLDREERVKSGQVAFGLSAGGHAYTLQTGMADFDLKGWGPQPVRTIWQCGFQYAGYFARGNSGIRRIADIKGKKVAAYVGYPGMHMNMEGLLAYAGLTWDDVKKTPVGGYAPGMQGVQEGAVDVAYAAVDAKPVFELAASPYGIHWLPMPASETEAWKRYRKIWGCWIPGKANYGAGISKDKPVEIMAWAYNITCREDQDENLCYWMTKQLAESYAGFKDKHAFVASWTLDQALNHEGFIVPYHSGSIKYFKETGRWRAEHQKKQEELLAEQIQFKKIWEAKQPK